MKVIGDIAGVYTDDSAECLFITSYILSKGNIKTGKVVNKFCNLEVLECKKMFYIVATTGGIGASNSQARVFRLQSLDAAKFGYFDEVRKREAQGYKEVSIATIAPNCSKSAENFVKQSGLVSKEEVDNVVSKIEKTIGKSVNTNEVKGNKNSSLDSDIRELVQCLFEESDIDVKEKVSARAFDGIGSPVGALTLQSVNSGRELLEAVSKVVRGPRTVETELQLEYLSNQYNTVIPRKLRRGSDDWLLDSADKIMEQVELLDNLEYKLAVVQCSLVLGNELEGKYNALNCDIKLLTDDRIIRDIKKKISEEHLYNHKFKINVGRIFEVKQRNVPKFDDSCGNVVSLFHGTKSSNLVSILSGGLKLPLNLGKNVQRTGSMFGSGVYFGKFSKAAQYSNGRFTNKINRKSYILLCDVALGKGKFLTTTQYYSKAPTGYNSVIALGRSMLDKGIYLRGIGDTKDFKMGADKFRMFSSSQVIHDEYVIFNQSRYKIKYIIEIDTYY